MVKIAPAIVLALALVAVAPRIAAADEPATQPPPAPTPQVSAAVARADALFQEGKDLFEAGKLAEACSRLTESDALDPTVGTIGLLAGCHERQGRVATAWKEYRETEKRARAAGDSRATFAQERALALEARLPRLTVSLARPSPGIEVLRNADPVPKEEFGADIPVDPGTWEIVARAPDRREFRATVTVKEGAREAVLVPELKLLEPPVIAPPSAQQPPIEPPATGNPRLTAALIAGGIGLTGLGVGIALGATASAQNSTSNALQELCLTKRQGCVEGQQLRSNVFNAAAASTIGFSVGIAGVATGALLLLIPTSKRAPKPPPAFGIQWTPVVGAHGGGAAMTGRF